VYDTKGDGIDENSLVKLLPTVDDIPVPPWFTDEFHDISGNPSSGYEDWSEDAMETLGIEKEEEGNGGKQPGFEFVVMAIALIFVTVIMRRRDKT